MFPERKAEYFVRAVFQRSTETEMSLEKLVTTWSGFANFLLTKKGKTFIDKIYLYSSQEK